MNNNFVNENYKRLSKTGDNQKCLLCTQYAKQAFLSSHYFVSNRSTRIASVRTITPVAPSGPKA